MLQALVESNLPKLLKEDAILFLGILRDLFLKLIKVHMNMEIFNKL